MIKIPKLHYLIDQALSFTFYLTLGLIPLVFSPANSELFEMPKMFLTYLATSLVIFFWGAKSILEQRFVFKRSPLDIPLVLFLVSQIISTVVSIDRHTSIFGYYSRLNGGLLSSFSYAILYWAYVSNINREKTLKALTFLLSSGLIISLWGIMEHFGKSPSCLVLRGELNVKCWAPDVRARVFATLGQPNWLAAWLTTIAPLSWWYLLKNSTPKLNTRTVLSYALPTAIFLAILFTKSRSGLLAFGVSWVLFWGFLLLRRNFQSLKKGLILGGVILIFVTFFGSPVTPALGEKLLFTPKKYTPAQEEPQIEHTGGTESFDIRMIVWRGAVRVWRHYPIFGSGVETFAYSYYEYRSPEHNLVSEWDLLYNKAHNEFLNYLATTGVVGLFTHLLLIGTFLFTSLNLLRKKEDVLSAALFSGFTSILVTNYVGFSVVTVATLFHLLPAMSYSLKGKEDKARTFNFRFLTTRSILFVPLTLATLYLLSSVFRFHTADTLYSEGKKLNDKDRPKEAAPFLEKAIRRNPYEPKYYDELGDITSRIAVILSEKGDEKSDQEFAQIAQKLSDQAISISPRSLNLFSSRAITLKRMSAIDQKYLEEAKAALEEASRLAPTDASTFYNLGLMYLKTREVDKAVKTLEKTVTLKPNYNEARVALAELYIILEEKDKAKEQVEYVIQKIDPRDEEAKRILEDLSQ